MGAYDEAFSAAIRLYVDSDDISSLLQTQPTTMRGGGGGGKEGNVLTMISSDILKCEWWLRLRLGRERRGTGGCTH